MNKSLYHYLFAKYQTYEFNCLFSQQVGVKALEQDTLSCILESKYM